MSDLNRVIREIKPCENSEPYVFISYSSADRELVWRDVLEFQKRGYNVWLDEKNLDKTKDSWKEDALTAIEDMDCMLLVFYVSASSLRSEACYQELSKTIADSTKALHFGPVKFIAVDAEMVGDIKTFHQQVFEKIRASNLDKEERRKQALALNGFMQQFFNSNNEKVRIHPKNEENRKMDYYEEILASFPDETRIYPEEESEETPAEETAAVKAESVPEMPVTKEESAESKAVVKTESANAAASAGKEPDVRQVFAEEQVTVVETAAEEEICSKTVISAEASSDGQEAVAEEKEEAQPVPDHFTHYEERPQNWKYGRNPFRKKNVEEAQQGNGLYRLMMGYTGIDIQLFGSIFGGRTDIVRMELPDSIEKLNSGEFRDCVNMKEIHLPRYLEQVAHEAFKGCSSLVNVEVPGNVTVIDSRAFQGCSCLRQIKLPEGLKALGMLAFEKCYSLQEIYLSQALEEMGISCFSGCTSLTEVTIPGGVKKIPSRAFDGCSSLCKVVVEEGVEEIDAAFGECGRKLEIWIPASVVKISGIAFYKTVATIHCDAGSYAQTYAEKENVAYILNDRAGEN